jgi:hypothetical protein
MLHGSKVVDYKKFDASYKPNNIDSLFDADLDYELQHVKVVDPKFDPYLLPEDKYGFKADIDRLNLGKVKDEYFNAKEVLKRFDGSSSPSRRLDPRFPSVLEKIARLEEESRLNVTDNSVDKTTKDKKSPNRSLGSKISSIHKGLEKKDQILTSVLTGGKTPQ